LTGAGLGEQLETDLGQLENGTGGLRDCIVEILDNFV
jgi:hypothetical protein